MGNKELSNVHYSRTMTSDNLSKAANYVGKYVLKGLGAFGKIMTAPFISQGPTSATIYKSKELLAKERTIENKSEELLGKAMTWASPLNYGAALATGNGLDARKGEEEVASWSPAWLTVGRLGELYVGPKAVKGVGKGVKAGTKAAVRTTKNVIKNSKAKEVSKTIDKVVDEGFKPRLSSDENLYRTTTNKEVSALKSGRFEVHPNGGNHGVYGWRRGEPFYLPGSMVESKMVGKRNGLIGIKDPTYLVAPIKEDLQVRIGSGGKYSEPVPATEVESGTHAYYHPSGGLAYDNSSIGFLPGDRLPSGIVAWSKKNGKWLFEPIEQPKTIFRAKVYKGGNITDPNSAFFTTDVKYARQYGPAQEYVIETKNPAFTEKPMMGYRDPVSLDMFVYEATKNNPDATMIVGHDANTGEFAYQSNGIEMLSLSPNNIIKAGQRRPMNKTYPVYLGPKHSIKEVVNADGTINPRAAMRIQHEIAEYFDGYKMEHRLENPEWHKSDPTTYDHTKNVALSAWGLKVPYGFTKHDLMVAALGHDFGKIVAGDGHAQIGADLLKLVFPDMTEALYKAVAEHMGLPTTPLGKATKLADIRNGRTSLKLLFEKKDGKNQNILGSYTYKTPSSDTGTIDFLKEFFNRLKIQGLEYTIDGLKLTSKNVLIGLPEHIRDYLNENTIERNTRAMRLAGYSERDIQMYKDKVNEEMSKIRVGLYSGKDYNAANSGDFGGFFNDEGNFISVNKDAYLKDPKFTPDYVMKHEGRHLIDYRTGMVNELNKILEEAYDKDFLDIPNHEDAGSLKGYLHMDRERVTTNRDARDVLLSSKGKNLLNEHEFMLYASKKGLSNDMVDFLNKVIKYAQPEDIVNAVENSNGYGKRYIKYLRENNKLTSNKIEQLRLAMMHVGGYAAPIIGGGYTLYNSLNNGL